MTWLLICCVPSVVIKKKRSNQKQWKCAYFHSYCNLKLEKAKQTVFTGNILDDQPPPIAKHGMFDFATHWITLGSFIFYHQGITDLIRLLCLNFAPECLQPKPVMKGVKSRHQHVIFLNPKLDYKVSNSHFHTCTAVLKCYVHVLWRGACENETRVFHFELLKEIFHQTR